MRFKADFLFLHICCAEIVTILCLHTGMDFYLQFICYRTGTFVPNLVMYVTLEILVDSSLCSVNCIVSNNVGSVVLLL